MTLTGAAILFSRGMNVLQASPAAYAYVRRIFGEPMAFLLLLLWIATTLVQWVFVFRGRSEWTSDSGSTVILFVAVPTSVVCGICCFVLLFSAPTVQFNVGSLLAMELWSFWVHWWERFYYCVAIQGVVYFVWAIVAFATGHLPWSRGVAACGFFASVCGWLLLRIAFPTA